MKRISMVSVIDDDDLFQFIIKKLIQATENIDAILPFRNGQEAFDYFLENKVHADLLPDLVFLDLDMPVMNGWQFLEQFIKTTFAKRQIAIYICTVSINPRDREIYKHFSSLSGYLIKPITKEEIKDILEKELEEKL